MVKAPDFSVPHTQLDTLMGVDKVLWQQKSDDAGRSEGQNSDGEDEGWVE